MVQPPSLAHALGGFAAGAAEEGVIGQHVEHRERMRRALNGFDDPILHLANAADKLVLAEL